MNTHITPSKQKIDLNCISNQHDGENVTITIVISNHTSMCSKVHKEEENRRVYVQWNLDGNAKF
jgi:hypothetical protein